MDAEEPTRTALLTPGRGEFIMPAAFISDGNLNIAYVLNGVQVARIEYKTTWSY